jgi:hypothetical protein
MSPDEIHDFEEFWPYYVSQHLNPTCRTLHVIGTTIGLAHLPVALVFPPAIVPALTWGYGMAWIGHFFFEKNKPATWHSKQFALWSLRGDFRMLARTLTGTMAEDVRAVRAVLAEQTRESVPPPAAVAAN